MHYSIAHLLFSRNFYRLSAMLRVHSNNSRTPASLSLSLSLSHHFDYAAQLGPTISTLELSEEQHQDSEIEVKQIFHIVGEENIRVLISL